MAVQWLQNYWTKEGVGIPKDAPKSTGLALFAEILGREWWEMVKLNILFLLTSLLVVTIPAAIFAMASVSRAMVEDRNVYLLRDYLDALRAYWLKASVWAFVSSAALGLCAYAVQTYGFYSSTDLAYAAPLTVSLFVTLFVAMVACQFIVISVIESRSVLATIRLSALAILLKPLPLVGALLFVGALWLTHILFYPVSVFMPAAINFSLGMFAIVFGAHGAAMHVLALSKDRTGS